MKQAPTSSACTLRVRVTPNARKPGLALREDGVLLAKVTAPAVEGAANQALLRGLARDLDLPRSALRLVQGEQSRDKLLSVDLDEAELRRRLAPHLKESA